MGGRLSWVKVEAAIRLRRRSGLVGWAEGVSQIATE